MTTTLADELKLEIGLPDELGDNLLTNTSGQYGAWQWARADGTSGISITGDAVARTITAQRNATAGLTAVWTDYLPVTPGLYANARVDLLAITSGHKVTLGLQFYNSTHTVISAQYSSPSSTLTTLAFSSVTIPASASYARLVVVLDKTADPIPNSGSANANALVRFTRAMLTELAASLVTRLRWLFGQHDELEEMAVQHRDILRAMRERDVEAIKVMIPAHLDEGRLAAEQRLRARHDGNG